MDENRIIILGMSVQDTGLEFIVGDEGERRKGVTLAHSYFVEFAGETFGPRARDVMTEIQDLAEDVHFGWKRAPKETR
jgi:hypothetical protein